MTFRPSFQNQQSLSQEGGSATNCVPPGAPKWITGIDIEEALRVWQPYYPQLLTAEDALEILMNVHNLLDVMYPRPANEEAKVKQQTQNKHTEKEAVHCTGTCQQP